MDEHTEHMRTYLKSMKKLDKTSLNLKETSTAIQWYSKLEVTCSSKVHGEYELLSLEALDGEDSTDNVKNGKRLELIQLKLTEISKVKKSLFNLILQTLTTQYGILELALVVVC